MKEIGKTLEVVVVDRYQSHLHESVRTFLREALRCIYTQGLNFIQEKIDFGRINILISGRPGVGKIEFAAALADDLKRLIFTKLLIQAVTMNLSEAN